MVVKKSGGKIFGASLTANEKKAMQIEIDKQIDIQLARRTQENEDEIIARILWVLRREFGFGEKRLREFFEAFDPSLDELVRYYQMDEKDDAWLCKQKLLDEGIDFSSWRNGSDLRVDQSNEA